ncbi:EAL domain-containing protein [Endozoicomonas sp. OPT23]|uniref:EAL domain-containing response regulator n=1 Tax=Endozoicomonas sp. OPT23 TaxID=2072845 RepID=UPI001891BDFE|nr:EAL domain-containing response regulator [Endozoicomonas sp. OPT23]
MDSLGNLESLKGHTILVVEDNDFQRSVALQVLQSLGIKDIHQAADGLQALKVLEQFGKVDVVICDLDMPGMDGIQFLGELAKNKLAGAVIVASAMEASLIRTVEDLVQEHGLKLLGTLAKPLAKKKLQDLLGRFTDLETEESTSFPQDAKAPWTVKELDDALSRKEFTLYHQPKVSMATGELEATEVLCRWQHPEHGLVMPDSFIPLMEESGQIEALTEQVIEKALVALCDFKTKGMTTKIGINLSAITLNDTSMPDRLFKQLSALKLSPELLMLEITESSLIDQPAKSLETLARLKMKGFMLSIDDFGTGYSSMKQLNRIPFSELKIDRSFVDGASEDKTRKAIIDANIGLAHTLGMRVVAEGVEQVADWHLLNELGCDIVQGYFVARPMPISELSDWLSDWQQRFEQLNDSQQSACE